MVRKMKNLTILSGIALLLTGCAVQRVYIGGNDGIHQARYTNHGILPWRNWMSEKLVSDNNVSYMAVKGRTLYAARRVAKRVFAVDSFRILKNGRLKKIDAFVIPGSLGYCHISVSNDGKFLLGSSYSGSFIDVLSLIPEGGVIRLKERFTFSGRSIHKRQKKSHPHFAAQTPDGSMVLVADLGCDMIHTFRCDGAKGLIRGTGMPLPPGSGPRHLAFSADGKFVFAANELNNTVSVFRLQKDRLTLTDTCSLLPAAWCGKSFAGAIKTAPDGRIYVTNRGHNSIAILNCSADGKLKVETTFPAEGDFPYDMEFYNGRFFTVNMKSDQLEIWEKNNASWKMDTSFTIRRPMCVIPQPEL